jgi:predicted dehydrogenase
MNQSQVNLALIGCGGIAQTHLDAIGQVPRIKLCSVYDVNSSAAAAVAQRFGCRTAKSAEEILKDDFVNAVLICVPPVYHYDLLKKAIHAGKHVLSEKPFTTLYKEAEEIKKLAAKSGRHVMMASKFRFVQDVIDAKKILEQGTIGQPIMAEVIFCSIVDMESRWNSKPAISGGGVLIDNGSHAADLINYLVGPIKNLYAQAGKRTQKIKVEDTARLHFETGNGVIGMVDLSWSLYKHTKNYVNIFGTEGTIEIGWKESIVWKSKEKTSQVYGTGYQKLSAFVNQFNHFADCVLQGAKPRLTTGDAVSAVRVIETAYESIRQKKWLKVP